MTTNITVQTKDETGALGALLGSLLKGGDVVVLDGDLGAGKTALSKSVASALGASQELTSPTFNLVLEYPLKARPAHAVPVKLLRHFDLYRLDSAAQLDDFDYFGLIEDTEAVSLVEWGSKFADGMPLEYLHVKITASQIDSEQRDFALSAKGKRAQQLLDELVNEWLATHG